MTLPAVGEQATAAWADARPPSASGSVTGTPTSLNVPFAIAVTFPVGRFTVAPMVVAACNASSDPASNVTVVSITTSGCSLRLTRSNALSLTTCYWIATQSI